MPLPRLPVGAAHLRPIPLNQRADGRVAVHRLKHLKPGTVQPHNRQIIVEGRKPPFVGMVLIGDQVGDVPSQELESFSREMTGFVNSNSGLHVNRETLGAEAYTSV